MTSRNLGKCFSLALALLLMGAGPHGLLVLTMPASEVRIIDGDSIALGSVSVRILGIDTPELRGDCAQERMLAAMARTALLRWQAGEATVTVQTRQTVFGRMPEADKYGRPLVRLSFDGRDVAERLIASGLASEYTGGRRQVWCLDE